MTRVQDNIVEHVLECIALLDTFTVKYRKSPNGKSEQDYVDRNSVLDMLEEISILLCKLLSTMITAPITGRMFTPLPSSKFNTDNLHSSAQEQMSQK